MTPVLEDCVKSILTQVRLLRQISAEFWSFASSPTARPALTRLSDLVREVAEPYRTGLGTHIEVVLDVSSDLPRVLIDPTLTARALTNIVENAIHAMPGGGRLRIAVRLEAGRLALSVTDTGVGMDDDARAHIFEPYFSTRSSGTGLGLTIAKRNVELSGGTIAVGSVPGEGATVTMSFSLDGSPDVSR
jgi:signal transduction histidine kinase